MVVDALHVASLAYKVAHRNPNPHLAHSPLDPPSAPPLLLKFELEQLTVTVASLSSSRPPTSPACGSTSRRSVAAGFVRSGHQLEPRRCFANAAIVFFVWPPPSRHRSAPLRPPPALPSAPPVSRARDRCRYPCDPLRC
ncbi:hypothetical protein ACQJBY_059605 [Aegilops geniculata]